MNIRHRVEKMEQRQSARLRVILASAAAEELARAPKRKGDVIVILEDDAEDL